MRKLLTISFLFVFVFFFSFTNPLSLRSIYSSPPSEWPSPIIDKKVNWTELGILPPSPIENQKQKLQPIIDLGKALFFDTHLSGSGKISCATCHQPELSWTDGRKKSLGHEGVLTKRNSPTIQNTWFYKKLFWDGRARDLEDQAFAPINSESEMHNEMPEVMRSLRKSGGYRQMFKKAFGDDNISPDRLTEAIAVFEKTIISRKSRFDEFLEGNKNILSDAELRGLHIFRTKARCMNCHHGPMFSDNDFHNNGFSGNDKGLYQVTHKDEDLGKMKTPSLRDVMKTKPWMHDGEQSDMIDILKNYSKAKMPVGTDPLIKPLNLSKKEIKDLVAFLESISVEPVEFKKPVLPD